MRFLTALLAAAALLAVPALAAGNDASVTAAKNKKCDVPAKFPEDGGAFTSLTAGTGVKCTSAASVATAWAKCAAANGKGGRCVKKVKDYACQETATTVGTTRTSKVTCKKKKLVVKFGVTRTV